MSKKTKINVEFPKIDPKEIKTSDLDEEYLRRLEEKSPKKIKTEKSDKVKRVTSSVKKSTDHSFKKHIAKAFGFLILVLLLFYGFVFILKKGFFRKGKLGILNNSKIIEILSTTYIAPKRSLILLKVHKQLFLVANTEKGIEFLSQIDDFTGSLKEGERKIFGSNFDTKLEEEKRKQTPLEEKKKAKTSYSNQIKQKIKELKPLQ